MSSCPGFQCLPVNFMAGPSKKMRVNDELLYGLLPGKEYCDNSESDYSSNSEINVEILSCGEQSQL
jgi:hypothetical protein